MDYTEEELLRLIELEDEHEEFYRNKLATLRRTVNISLGEAEIEHRFGFHKATIEGANATLPKHRDVRLLFREFAAELDRLAPPGRAKSEAFTNLENASMWFHKAIAETAPAVSE